MPLKQHDRQWEGETLSGSGFPSSTAVGAGLTGGLVLVAGRKPAAKPAPPVPQGREAVGSARLAARLAEIERAGGRVLVMQRKRGSATWLLTVDGLSEGKEHTDELDMFGA